MNVASRSSNKSRPLSRRKLTKKLLSPLKPSRIESLLSRLPPTPKPSKKEDSLRKRLRGRPPMKPMLLKKLRGRERRMSVKNTRLSQNSLRMKLSPGALKRLLKRKPMPLLPL